MQDRHLVIPSAALLALVLTACAPRGVAPGDVPAPAPEPPPVETPAPPPASGDARALFDEGILLGRQGRWADAADRYRRAADSEPRNPAYHMALADALLAQGRESDGATAMEAGIRAEEALSRPNHRVLAVDYERLIVLLNRLNRLDEAREARRRQAHHRALRDAASP
jgi:predicted Zn-dependent protease